MKHKTKGRLGVAASVVAIAGVTAVISASAGVAAPTAAGGSNDVQTQVRKSVSLTGNADGSVAEAAMVTQVTAVGNGTATINVPIGTNSIRNLNGFASVPAQNNEAVFNLNVSGSTEQRIYTKSDNGPINVTVTATLDGQPIKPGDVVGKTGVLSVNYRVVNTANSMQTVTYKDARGDVVTDTVKVDAPIGGSLDVYLPQGFNEVTAPGASVGGDGMGQTKLSYSMVLFKPLGDPVANLTYQSRITNGTLPGGVFTFLPIVPLDNSTVAATKKAYEGGAQVGTDIYGAGTQIGENLVKLQTGAGQLITGLGTAVAGANELSTKLAGGIPDANKLVKGTRDLSNGISGPLSSGANQLAAGLDKLSNTINTKLAPGAAELSGGAAQLSAALADLQTGVENLPDTVKGEQDYQDAVAGLLGLRGMLTAITTYATDIGAPSPTGGTGNMGTIQTAIATYCAGSTTPDPATCQGLLLAPSANAMIGMVAAATNAGTINAIINVPGTVGPGKPSAQQIVTGLLAGLPVLLDKIAAQLLGGPCHTGAKLPTDGIKQIACGGKALAAGAATLSAGIGTYPGSESDQNTLVGGAMALAAGASTLSNTVDGTLAPGAALIADGTVALPASLTAASEGAGQLATGLGAAVTGVGAIQDGAGQLKAEGSDKLATTGEKAQLGYATDVATINALQQVGVSGTAIPYGPATGPNVQTTGVYQLTLPAASTGGSNALLYGLAVLGLLIGGALVAVAWRRRA